MKPLYKFLIIFLILGIIAWIIYFVASKTSTTGEIPLETQNTTQQIENTGTESQSTTTEPETLSEETENITGEENYGESDIVKTSFKELNKISDTAAQFYWYYEANNRIFYITENGEIKKVIDGKSENISINPIKNVAVARPNHGGSLVLLKFATDSGMIWGIFSSMDEKITPINQPIIDAVWDFNNQDIVASLNQGTGVSIISLSGLKNYTEKTVLIPELNLLDVDMIKKSKDELLFIEKFGNEYATSIWQYNLKTKLFSTVRKGLLDFSIKPDISTYFFYSKNDGFVIGNSSLERVVPTTKGSFPEKCSSIVTTVFCFVPEKSVSLFDWMTNSLFTDDDLYTYDTYDQTENQVPFPENTPGPIDAKNIIATHSAIYFINKYDNFIYELK